MGLVKNWNTNTAFSQNTGIPTPETGFSEWVSDKLGYGRDAQGGSGLIADAGQTANQGGNIQWNALSSYPADTKTAPIVNNRPQTQIQQPTGGGGFDMSLYPGWNETAARADFAATGGPNRGSGGGSPNMIDQINSLYGNTNQLYDQYMTKQLPSELETALGTIDTQKTQSERSASSALQQAMADFKSQQETTYQNQRSSESALIRQRNAAVNQGQAMYGGGSSAGQVIYEIINQEFMRSSGNVKVATQNSFNAIFKEQSKAQSFYSDYLMKLNEDVKNAVGTANNEFNNRMLQIQMAKAQNEDAKNQAKMAVLQDQQQKAEAIQNWKLENVLSLETWKAQQMDTLNQSTQYVGELAQKLATDQMFSGYQGQLSSVSNKQNFSTVGDTNYQNPQNKTNDPWSEIMNPFA